MTGFKSGIYHPGSTTVFVNKNSLTKERGYFCANCKRQQISVIVWDNVVDRHRFNTNLDLDPTFHFDADPDPDPTLSFTHH
jgi:hypothetical protein